MDSKHFHVTKTKRKLFNMCWQLSGWSTKKNEGKNVKSKEKNREKLVEKL